MTSTVSQVDEIRVTDQSSLFGKRRKGSRLEIIAFFLCIFIFIYKYRSWVVFTYTDFSVHDILVISDLVECTGRS
jgi:hypothetical protein